jgi:hypothetical protein
MLKCQLYLFLSTVIRDSMHDIKETTFVFKNKRYVSIKTCKEERKNKSRTLKRFFSFRILKKMTDCM